MSLQRMLLPGLPVDDIAAAFAASPGDEIASGKIMSPESSAALAANAFGFFLNRPQALPPPVEALAFGWSPCAVRLEAEFRFPFRGGRHPWLDASIETDDLLIGVESKRFEPFRSKPSPHFSEAYWRDVWGDRMRRYGRVRDELANCRLEFTSLDAAQLVKHAYGLRTAVQPGKACEGKEPVLLYVYATPESWPDGRAVDPRSLSSHAAEVRQFAELVSGDEVVFLSVTYRQMISGWRDAGIPEVVEHAHALHRAFKL